MQDAVLSSSKEAGMIDAAMAEAQRITRLAARPIEVEDNVKSTIARAARRIGLNYRRARSFWYASPEAMVRAAEMELLRAFEAKLRDPDSPRFAPEAPDDPITVTLTAGQWNRICAILAEQPYRVSAPLIHAIRQQTPAGATTNGGITDMKHYLAALFALCLGAHTVSAQAGQNEGVRPGHAFPSTPQPAINPQAYYVSPNGLDSNPGTLAAPFKTWAKAQAAMEASSAVKTTYFRGGTYPLTPTYNGCGSSGAYNGIQVQHATDSNTTYSYYPPDGVGSAIFDGRSTGNGVGTQINLCIQGTSPTDGPTGVSIIGLTFRNSQWQEIFVDSVQTASQLQNVNLQWNTTYSNYTQSTSFGGAISVGGYVKNATINGNYVFAAPNMGISAVGGIAGGVMNNLTIENNVVEGCCGHHPDTGCIYIQDFVQPVSTGIVVKNNYCNSTLPNRGIYLDDGTSNVNATGNVVVSQNVWGASCAFIHGGSNNVFEHNICDLVASPTHNAGPLTQQQTGATGTWPMTGNKFQNNTVVCNTGTANCGNGYGAFTPPALPAAATVSNNNYFNYGTGGSVNSAGSGGATGDASPTYQNPGISCWNALVMPNYAWGPPGQVGSSQGQNTPSWGPAC